MPRPETTAALLAAVAPVAAYCARTPPPNRHADHLAALVNAAADYVGETERENETPPGPNWERITDRILHYLPNDTTPSPVAARTRAHLDSLHARAAQPLPGRMAQARICSHHLGTPDSL